MPEEAVRRSLDAAVSVESIDAVQDALADWWGAVGDVPPRLRAAFETAVVEIAGNIVEHTLAAHGAEGRRFTLDLEADAGALRARFQDNGLPVELDLSAVTMADADDENGRGLALTLASVDSLDYHRAEGRNIWSLECRRG